MVLTLGTQVVLSTDPIPVPGIGSGELPVDLPRLGSQRRVVMSQMRRAGSRVVDARGDRIVFTGGPQFWPGLSTTTYVFRYLVAEELQLGFTGFEDLKSLNRVYTDAQRRLTQWFGAPWLERLPDGPIGESPLRTMFEWPGFHIELTTSQSPEALVVVSIKRSAHLTAKQEVESVKNETAHYDPLRGYIGWSTKVKSAIEALFDDFGELQMVREGAQLKGAPLKVSLRKISLPRAPIPGVDRSLVEQRFIQMTSGHWHLEPIDDRLASDVEFRVAFAPTQIDGEATYAIRLEAFRREAISPNGQTTATRRIYTARHRL